MQNEHIEPTEREIQQTNDYLDIEQELKFAILSCLHLDNQFLALKPKLERETTMIDESLNNLLYARDDIDTNLIANKEQLDTLYNYIAHARMIIESTELFNTIEQLSNNDINTSYFDTKENLQNLMRAIERYERNNLNINDHTDRFKEDIQYIINKFQLLHCATIDYRAFTIHEENAQIDLYETIATIYMRLHDAIALLYTKQFSNPIALTLRELNKAYDDLELLDDTIDHYHETYTINLYQEITNNLYTLINDIIRAINSIS